jgi:hydrogenase expression/formation protein HypD
MEFCGGHTNTIFRYGIRQLLPGTVNMVSGPGCPVCVTAPSDLDRAIAAAGIPDVILTTFGDMMRVPGSYTSLQEEKAAGADVRVVYSPVDALTTAMENPDKSVIFLGIGFETTAPTVAASILEAEEKGIDNYFVLSLHKICPPVIRALLDSGEIVLNGLVCPGHVSAVTGSGIWEFIASEYGIPCVVTGFEPPDVLRAISMLVAQIERGEAKVENAYSRGVRSDGNPLALDMMERVFREDDAEWRGIGAVKNSGLVFRKAFERFDAEKVFEIPSKPPLERKGCLCGEILRGVKMPGDCPLFGRACTPASPVGPCMVSSEGTCSAYYRYGESDAG